MRNSSELPHDPRFNAIHWISDCWFMSHQIEYSCRQIDEIAQAYRGQHRPGDNPSDSIPKLSYYADNAIIRLMSFSDKLGLCLYSFFEDFDPNGSDPLLSLADIMKVLRGRMVRRMRDVEKATAILEPVLGRRPNVLKQYRDAKIHRREPRIEFFGVKEHHDLGYLIPVETEAEFKRLSDNIAKTYTDPAMRDDILEMCKVEGVYYRVSDRRKNPRLFPYQRVSKALNDYRRVCYEAANEAASFLGRRKPFRGRD